MGLVKDVINVELHNIDSVTVEKSKYRVTENDVKDEDKGGKKVKVDLDTILINEVGQFGWFQLRTLALAGIAALFSASNGEYVFTAARIKARYERFRLL